MWAVAGYLMQAAVGAAQVWRLERLLLRQKPRRREWPFPSPPTPSPELPIMRECFHNTHHPVTRGSGLEETSHPGLATAKQ